MVHLPLSYSNPNQADEDAVQELYKWIDEIPLSRPKRNLARDFSDGLLCAEVVANFIPKLVDLHNYPSSMSSQQKKYNWNTLNQKVFKKLGFHVRAEEIDAVSTAAPGAVENILLQLRVSIEDYIERRDRKMDERRVLDEEAVMAGDYGDPYPVPQQAWTGQGHVPDPRGRGRGRRKAGHDVGAVQRQFDELDVAPRRMEKSPGVRSGRGSTQSPRTKAKLRPGGALEPGLTYADFEDQERQIAELRQLVEALRTRLRKAENLLQAKDQKIEMLERKVGGGGRGRY